LPINEIQASAPPVLNLAPLRQVSHSLAASSCSCRSSHPFGRARFAFSRIAGIQPDPAHPRRFLYQLVRGLPAVPRHHASGSQSKAQRIRLVLKIKNNLARHKRLQGFSLLYAIDSKGTLRKTIPTKQQKHAQQSAR
jgi:hypothetical protein